MRRDSMSNPVYIGTCPSLFDLWVTYRFDTRTLATESSVPQETILSMISDFPVTREEAEKVFGALSALYHKNYTHRSGDNTER
jgi:hypothetical protein